jgi:hypothetical protein
MEQLLFTESLDDLLLAVLEPCDPPKVVVRVRTSFWSDRRGLHTKRDLTYLKTLSSGHNFLAEDAGCIGANDIFPLITNLDNDLEDGIYEVIISAYDADSENVDYYEYTLVPFNEPTDKSNSPNKPDS